ncbi:DUF2147 domain-containing protein [Pararhodonellum marinum]|uniref:DUF2147 domain-containing protein n=1 Tax=Pararhodonellum marinum TaxID=2755358 RepID=UPI00188EFE87|nr:DUF2147 domain-containing protein [Pararhodonellum marinum]
MKTLSFLSALFFLLSFHLMAQKADDIVGEWYNTEKDAKIEIYQNGDTFHGKIVWLENPEEDGKPRRDVNNSDKSKRDRPIMGMNLLRDFKYNDGTWEDGTIYDPKNGKTYSCIIKKKNPEVLEVRGYVGISLIGRTVEWTKAK